MATPDLDTSMVLVAALAGARATQFQVVVVDDLQEALDSLAMHDVDVFLVDLRVASPRPLEGVTLALYVRPDVPVVAIAGPDEWPLSRQAIWSGAHDVLVHGRITPDLLETVLRYAIERACLVSEIHELAGVSRNEPG